MFTYFQIGFIDKRKYRKELLHLHLFPYVYFNIQTNTFKKIKILITRSDAQGIDENLLKRVQGKFV
jgi:hypothetical protein